MLPRLVLWAALQGPPACTCPCAPAASSLLPTPRAEAWELNRQGRDLYRQRRWAEARQRYAASLAADPEFLGPRLNVATAHAQEGQFADAVREATALVDRAFVPWAREVREAADLAPLQARPEREVLEAALARAGAAWGAQLQGALLFVGRLRPPVRLPPASVPGVLHLGLEQEIFAWDPRSGRIRQVTAEDGRVLGFVASADGQALFYLRAGKLVRDPGRAVRLRDVTLRRLDLASMALGPLLRLPGDIQWLQLAPGRGASVEVVGRGETGLQRWRAHGQRLEAEGTARAVAPAGPGMLILDGQGAGSARPVNWRAAGCTFQARDARKAGQSPGVQIRAQGRGSGRAPFTLPAPHGAGLQGLPFPTTPPQ
jgi:hypothetical protein